jgi:hypothetical protein
MKPPATNLYQDGMSFDLYVFLSEQEEFGDFQVLFGVLLCYDNLNLPKVPESLVWKKEGLSYGDWNMGENLDLIFEHSTQFGISSVVQKNALSTSTPSL